MRDAPAVRRVEQRRALRGRSCPRENRRLVVSDAGSTVMRSPRSTRWKTVTSSCLPSGALRPDDEREVDLRGSRPDHLERLGERDELGRLELLGARRSGGGRSRRAPRRHVRATRRPASASELASVLRRWAKRASTSVLTCGEAPGAMRRKATSAESTFGRGRNTSRDTGWRPVRSVASWTSTETAPYAFVDGRAKNRSATSRCTITHQARAGRGREALGDDRRGDVVRQVGDELGRRRIERRDVEPQRVAPVHVACWRSRQVRREPPVDLDRVDIRDALGEDSGSAPRARARSRARRRPASSSASRSITPRMFSSTRKCCPSSLRGDDAHRPKTRRAFASIWRASSSTSTPRSLGERGVACARRRPARCAAAHRLRREVRAVGLGEQPLGRDAPRGARRSYAFL